MDKVSIETIGKILVNFLCTGLLIFSDKLFPKHRRLAKAICALLCILVSLLYLL